MTDFVYDIEVLPNVFTCTALNLSNNKFLEFEISPRKNDFVKFLEWVNKMIIHESFMIGFNNYHYDYPVIHHMVTDLKHIRNAKVLTRNIYKRSKKIISWNGAPAMNPCNVWENNHVVRQIDLFKIHHFENRARSTSLKRLQFNMRLPSIQEFGVSFNEPIKRASVIQNLLDYNRHDVYSTKRFMDFSQSNIKFRREMTEQFGKSFYNYNDTKIGEDYLTLQLQEKVGDEVLYHQTENGRKKRTTPRSVVNIKDFIFDYVQFEHPEFQRVLDKMKGLKMFVINGKFHWNEHDEYPQMVLKIKKMKSTLTQMRKDMSKGHVTKEQVDVYKERLAEYQDKYANHHINCTIDGFTFEFGKGGLHGTLRDTVVRTTNKKLIYDLDVTSYYPSIGIENNLYPEHLTEAFCPIYAEQRELRLQYAKGTTENDMLKLALNGTYGKTNSAFSVFYDPLYTMTTTVNGQLMLCMLWEQLAKIDGVRLIQANTDGITIEIDRTKECKRKVSKVCNDWQRLTRLKLEQAIYTRMWVRDGNNYIAEYKDGKLKSKGAYLYKSLYHEKDMDTRGIEWHKNHSMLVVQKAVEAELVHGIPARKFITEHDDVFDFFLCTNVPKTYNLMIGDGVIPAKKKNGHLETPAKLNPNNVEIQRVSRYVICNEGGQLTKVMPPLKGKDHVRFSSINKDYLAIIHNDIKSDKVKDYDINYDFYINEANKLLEPFRS